MQSLKWEAGGFLRHALVNDLPMVRPAPTAGSLLLVAVLTAFSIAVVWLLLAGDAEGTPGWRGAPRRRGPLAVVLFGVVWTMASLSIFLPFIPYRYETLRVHSLAQFGSILVFAAAAKVLSDRHRIAGVALLAGGIIAALFIATQNARMWLHWSHFESQAIAALTVEESAAPQPSSLCATILIDCRTSTNWVRSASFSGWPTE